VEFHVLYDVLFGNLTVRRMEFWERLRQPIVLAQKLRLVLFIPPPNGFQPLLFFQSQRASRQILERVACVPDVGGNVARRIDNGGRVKDRVEERILTRDGQGR
jgi:hypothetical protein